MAGRPARKPKVITLAPYKTKDVATGIVTLDTDARKQAEAREFMRATPERLAKADSFTYGADRVERIIESPVDILHKRGMLDRTPDRNDALHNVATKFRTHWDSGGLHGVTAMDMGRDSAGIAHAHRMPISQFAAENRDAVNDAITHLGPFMAGYLVAIVAEDQSPEQAGRKFTDRIDRATASGVAIEVLKGALTSLGAHWRMLGR
jgi:hypothetical protein